MKSFSVSAPGKLFLSGEYAILEGGSAVVTTVNRRATAKIVEYPVPVSPVLRAAAECSRRDLGVELQQLPTVSVNTDSFSCGRDKLGIGSSAAVAISACGVFFEWAGLSVLENKNRILQVALEAHAMAQGGKGSGADVTASTLGGTIIFRLGQEPEPVKNIAENLVVVWTGKSATTSSLLEQVGRFKAANPASYHSLMGRMVEQSDDLAHAFGDNDLDRIMNLIGEYYSSMLRLQEASGAPIITDKHALISKLAVRAGGVAKPSGAGGGDTAIAIFKNDTDAAGFGEACSTKSLEPLDVSIHTEGLATANISFMDC